MKGSRRVIARLPVPRPLPASVKAAVFGRHEDGSAIRPEPDEVREITESLADRLIELLDAVAGTKQESARQGFEKCFRDAVAMFGLHFGDRAAVQLEAYVRRQASLDDDKRAGHDTGRHR
ncbi:MAG TPA: hypothetical protein VHQ47_06150 [Phycisphaerae bacterium]|nr:hypothetical protein [Phycisphaerae bacterium]